MNRLLAVAFVGLAFTTTATAGRSLRLVSAAGAKLEVPSTWSAAVSKTPSCDPERLIVVASPGPFPIKSHGALSPPARHQVLILLLEDRYRQDRPLGDLRRPNHFSIAWNRLVRIQGDCGLPDEPAFIRYVKANSRYLGFIIYPGHAVSAQTKTETFESSRQPARERLSFTPSPLASDVKARSPQKAELKHTNERSPGAERAQAVSD